MPGIIGWIVVVGAFLASNGGASASPPLPLPSVNVPDAWLTRAEASDFRQTPRYAETIEYCKRLAADSGWIEYRTFGSSPQGRDLPLLIASNDGSFTPESAHSNGKLVVFVQNCIHAGECAGKDASLMLLRDIAVLRSRAALLDNVTLLINPIFNVDGHERFGAYSRSNQNGPDEMGWRVTSRNLNLNRDYMKADTVEMRAWLSLWTKWQPDLHMDNHTTDGGDWQYDVIFDADTHATASPFVAKWLSDVLYPHLFDTLAKDGHVPAIYFGLLDSRDPSKGIASGGFGPRFATGYVSLWNRPSILVEMHALKTYRTRVIGTYNIMKRVLEKLNADPISLRDAINQADAKVVAQGATFDPNVSQVLSVRGMDASVPFRFQGFGYRHELSDVSGAVRVIYDNTKPIELDTTWRNQTEPDKTVTPPLAYAILPQWTEAIELLDVHGLTARRLIEPTKVQAEVYRFSDVTFASRSFEGRTAPRFSVEKAVEACALPKGSVIVSLDQRGAKVAMQLFEPEAPDSLLRWGFFNAIFERKEYAAAYVLEDRARRMLGDDPALRTEFETKVRTDREFAASARSRLNFFHERSPYHDEKLNRYPIVRLLEPISAKTVPLGRAGQ